MRTSLPAQRRRYRRTQTGVVGLLIGALVAGMGALGATAALAAPPEVTFTLEAVDQVSGATVSEVESGADFTVTASVGCPDPSGCGPASLTIVFPEHIEFIADGFTPPNGATHVVDPPGAGTARTTTLSWDTLSGTAVVFFPVRVVGSVAADQNGVAQKTTGVLVAGAEEDLIAIEDEATIALRVFEQPGIERGALTWSADEVREGSQSEAIETATAIASANAVSSLRFRSQNGETLPNASLPTSEAFDLESLTLSQNPGGAHVAFTLANGDADRRVLQPEELEILAPTEAVGYEVTVAGLPARASAAELERTVAVSAVYRLRDLTRSTGERIIEPKKNFRDIRSTVEAANVVQDIATGAPAETPMQLRKDIRVSALAPALTHKLTWETASGDATSVYGSGEASTLSLQFANSGVPTLRDMTFEIPGSTGKYFEFQELSVVPSIVFPAGAQNATVQYRYATEPKLGEVLEFGLGEPVPAPVEDGRELAEVSGIIVEFFAPEDSPMVDECSLADECAGLIELSGTLRDFQLSSGAPIVPPQSGAATRVEVKAKTQATASTGATLAAETGAAWLSVVKPQFDVKLTKRFGDGTGRVVYPLTGVASTGDIFDPSKDPQDFTDHLLRFVASTSPAENATEKPGATALTVADPQTTPTVERLGSNPFNTIKFTNLQVGAAAEAVCTTADNTPVPSSTSQQVWVLDQAVSPRTITLVPYTEDVDLDSVVGLELTILPVGDTRFPLDVSCASAADTTVSFRDTQLSTGAKVSPATVGSEDTPGLLSVGNTAELTTGQNLGTANGADSLYLVDLDNTSIYKDYAGDAKSQGVQGQESPTSFLLAGVPAQSTTTHARIMDGNRAGSSLDVFAFAGLRDVKVGPDQQMRLTFRDLDGEAVGPRGIVEASTSLTNRELTDAEIEDSQSAGYREFQRTLRAIEWVGEWEDVDITDIYTVYVDVTRTDEAEPLQLHGAFSVVLDVTLRDTFLSDPAATVTGSINGTIYENLARIFSKSVEDGWTDPIEAPAEYTVFAVDVLLGEAKVSWKAADNLGGPARDDFLVAQQHTASRITLDASNKTAVGVSDVPAANQWTATGSLAVGMDRLSVGVGGTPESGLNPFAITDFAGLAEVRWPERIDAQPGETEAQRRVAGVVVYEFEGNRTQTIPAPVGTPLQDLNPDRESWGEVVSVKMRWSEPGKYVGIKRSNSELQGRIAFTTELRENVRDSYRYTFQAGEPGTLRPGDGINGPTGQVSQLALLSAAYRGELSGFESATSPVESDTMPIDIPAMSTAVNLDIPRNSTIYRDPVKTASGDTRWVLGTQNTGNAAAGRLRMATESGLLAGDWSVPETTQTSPRDGTAFDAMDITRVRLTYPSGAVSAKLWARGENGEWTAPIAASHNTDVQLPQAGAGPRSWAEVTGLRVQFDGDESKRQRILKRATGKVEFDTRLRDRLRSDATEIAPGTALPAGDSAWELSLDGGGQVYLPRAAGEAAEESPAQGTDSSQVRVEPGAPQPLVRKYAANYKPETNTGDTSIAAHPGTWVNFTVVLENRSGATSDLYELQAIDTLPNDLLYNAINESVEWKVTHAPEGVSTSPDMQFEQGEATVMRWTWPTGQTLKPGERIVIRVPLQLRDGMGAGTAGQNTARIVGTGIADAPAGSACRDEASLNSSCVSFANARALRSDSVRAEAYLDSALGGATTTQNDACDVTTIADWADGVWVRNPCLVDTTAGGTLKYRVKLINSGNSYLTQLRFVDQLPALNDQGAVLDAARGSEWTPELIPKSVQLVTGAAAEALGASGDGVLTNAGLRFTDTAKACTLKPDAYAGPNTLACDGGSWAAGEPAATRAFGGDIVFDPARKLSGGEYVLVDFEMSVPPTSEIPRITWNTAAVAGKVMPEAS